MEADDSGEGKTERLVALRVSELVLETRAAISIATAREYLKLHKRCGMPKELVAEANAVINGATRWPAKETT